MIIGVLGAHRSGKTSLCQEFVKRNKSYKFAPTSVSAIMLKHNMDPAKDYPLVERLKMQHIILDELDAHYSAHHDRTAFDRTPLDAAAYMLADVQRENVGAEHQKEIVAYIERAMDITNRRFSMLLFVPPVLKLVDEPGKAPATPAYVEHISQIIQGLKNDERVKVRNFALPRHYIDMDLRVRAMESATGRHLRNYLAEVEVMNDSGVQQH